MLEKNQIAPEFNSLNQAEQEVTLSSCTANKNVVLYFYPKDDTPGCTIEANTLRHWRQSLLSCRRRLLA